MGIVVFLYVALGGFWAVTWTDAIQGVLLFVAMVSIGLLTVIDNGGLVATWQTALEVKPLYGASSFDLWISGIGLVLTWTLAFASFPALVSRAFASADPRTASRSLTLSAALYGIFHFITIGIIAAGALTVAGTGLENPDMATIVVLREYTGQMVSGIVAAGILAALMSSSDSLLMGALAAVVHDVYKELYNPDLDQATTVRISRISAVVLGIIVVILAVNTPAIIGQVAAQVAGFAASSLFFPMMFATWSLSTTPKGAISGMFAGGGIDLVFILLGGIPPYTPVFAGVIASLLVTWGISRYDGTEPSEERKDAFETVHVPMNQSKE